MAITYARLKRYRRNFATRRHCKPEIGKTKQYFQTLIKATLTVMAEEPLIQFGEESSEN